MTHLTLVLLIDAFRRDYVTRTSFLRRLAARSRTGAMREHFGFVPRAGYFGGLGPSETGFTNMYCCDPVTSPFGLARGLPHTRAEEDYERHGMRAWVDADAKGRLPPYAAAYAYSALIPFPLLPWFDVVEKYAPWDRRVGYRSIFHELEDRDDPFFCCAWPESNRLADHSDRALVDHTLASVGPGHRLAYLHLQELDGLGHAYGPESSEVLSAIDATDALVERLIGTLDQRFDRLDLVLFGDHGMVSVTGGVDVWSAIQATGLTVGRDVVFFLDSTMARFWFPTNVARQAVIDALEPLPGRVLDAADLRRLDLEGCDPRNGELFFLAEPGHVITPNFFQRRMDTLRGMHGCEPDCPDNMGFFLVNDADHDGPADLGVVGPTAVYTELRRLLGLGRPETASMAATGAFARIEGAFTQHPDPAAHEMIRAHMTRIVVETLGVVPGAESIILGGSFGRDEGGVTRDTAGRFVPVNDYDIVVLASLAPDATRARLQTLGDTLARDFGTDFVHFSLWPDIQTASALTLANFDLRYGGRVLWGEREALDRLPRFAAGDLPLGEGVHLLYNRLGGILTGLERPAGSADLEPRRRAYLVNQTMKGRIALGDWHLLRLHAYDASYQTRRERFSWLASGLSLPPGQRAAILSGYQFKLHPDRVVVSDVLAAAIQTADWLVAAIIDATGQTTRRAVETPEDAAAMYSQILTSTPEMMAEDNALATRLLDHDPLVRVAPSPAGWVRQAIYASFPLVAAAVNGDERSFARACERLDACLTPPWPRDLTPDNWETVRARLSHAWLALLR